MHACDPVPIVMGLRLAALRAAGAPLQDTDTTHIFVILTLHVNKQ